MHNSTGLSAAPLLGGASLPPTLPPQLSQLCSGQQHQLLTLQQNFSHLLPPNYADTHHQLDDTLQRTLHQRHYHHHHHHHHTHPQPDHDPSHHARGHHNWRKSRLQHDSRRINLATDGTPHSLLDLSAKIVAEHIPFQSIEQKYEHIPEPVQRRIIFWSFPRHEDDIRMYSSLTIESSGPSIAASQTPSTSAAFQWVDNPNIQSHGPQLINTTSTNHSKSSQNKQLTFDKGLRLYEDGCVHGALQVGFNLSGTVKTAMTPPSPQPTGSKVRSSNNNPNGNNNLNNQAIDAQNNDGSNNPTPPANESSSNQVCVKNHRVSVTFDRCKITSVSCSCELQDIFWCEHVVALILYRIKNPENIDLRVPISETLLSLDRQQLQKLVQYIIAEHHTEVLPTAQRLLDEMRQSFSDINQIHGAPDPTAGASLDDEHIWHIDEFQVNEKVQNYLNLVCSNSKDAAAKQVNALFEKIREMFKARDTNGIRLLRLITEQFLLYAIRNEKSRPLWDQLVSLWVVVMLNPDLPEAQKPAIAKLLTEWSKAPKCPREDVERRISTKRKVADLSDDDEDDIPPNQHHASYGPSNNYPAHMASHRHRTSINSGSNSSVLRSIHQALPPICPCQLTQPSAKRMRGHHSQQNSGESFGSSSNSRGFRASGSSSNHQAAGPRPQNEARQVPQEPRSVFYRALDFQSLSWDDDHLRFILTEDRDRKESRPRRTNTFDNFSNPLWNEPISIAAARVETLRSHGYKDQALRLTVATVRRLKLQQDLWCIAITNPESGGEMPCSLKGAENYSEGWIGHPFDPINLMMDILLEASHRDANSTSSTPNLFLPPTTRCSCPYSVNSAIAEFTHRLIPDLASLSSYPRLDVMPNLPLMNLTSRRPTNSTGHSSSYKVPYIHNPVPGCCQKDSYLSLAVEVALIALGQQRSIPTNATAHERSVRQEAELISKLEAIDTSDSLLVDILKHQATLLREGGPFHNGCCGVSVDSTPLHTFARYLFDSLVPHYPQIAYKVGIHALNIPLSFDENSENYGAARTSPRSINYNHLQSEQLLLAQTMFSKAKDEGMNGSCLRKVHRASVKNIRNAASLLKLSRHVLKEARPNGNTLYPALLNTSFDLGLQVLKVTLSPHNSNGKTRKEAILFMVDCATDIGLDKVVQLMKEAKDYFSPTEALNLVVPRDNDHVNLRAQAANKLKLKDNPNHEAELNSRSRDLALECAARDPASCALEALKFCETDDDSLKRALKIVTDAGVSRAMGSSQLIKVADRFHERGLSDKAFDIAMVAVSGLQIPSNTDNNSPKKDIFIACEYAQKVNGFSLLIPKLISNIECATVLSEIYHRFCPTSLVAALPNYRDYSSESPICDKSKFSDPSHGGIYAPDYVYNNNPFITKMVYRQRLEEAQWWNALLQRTIKAFNETTRTRLLNISPRHYGEFIDFLDKAKKTFEKATDGPQQFKDLILEMMKSYKTKKKLIEKLKARFDYSIKTGT